MKTFDDGIERNLDPGEPEQRNIYEAIEAGKQVNKLPGSLGEALDALEADEVVKSALPDDMYRVFTHYNAMNGNALWPPSPSGTSRLI